MAGDTAYDAGPTLSQQTAAALRGMVQAYCGLQYGLDSLFFLERRAARRLSVLQLPSFEAYADYLHNEDAHHDELEHFVEQLTTHETYFFREAYQLNAFETHVLPSLASDTSLRGELRLWSAGCATGEEAYTLAMIMQDADVKAHIVATDISRSVLQQARDGCYTNASFRSEDARAREHFFVHQGTRRVVAPHLRASCQFERLNLLAVEQYSRLGRFDAIFCRNVLMYLAQSARETIVQGFYDALHPGGYLLLGHCESLLHMQTPFVCVELGRDLVYQRPTRHKDGAK